jgi:hypothetical protein
LAFDAGANPFARWGDNARLWEAIVAAHRRSPRWFTIQDTYGLREAVNTIPGLKLPSTLQLLGFMLCYTALIGPVNYVVLRKMDRRVLAWLTIPAVILGFTACAYLTGFQMRGTRAIVHRLAAIYVPEGQETGRLVEVVGLFSPRRTTYDLRLTEAGVGSLPMGYYGSSSRQPLRVVVESDGATVTDLRVDVGGIHPFIAEGYVIAPRVETDLRLVLASTGGLQLEGTVRNGDACLQDAVLITGGYEQRLGDLEAGQEVQVHIPYNLGYGRANLSEQILGTTSYWDDREIYRRYQFIQTLSASDHPMLGRNVYLVGWSDQSPPPAEVLERSFSSVEMSLYVYALPVADLKSGNLLTIPADLVVCQVEETVGDVNVWPEGFHMGYEAEVVYRCTLLPGLALRQLNALELDLQGSAYGSQTAPPVVSLWNVRRQEWDVIPMGWGQHKVTSAQDYFIAPGDVLIRLETEGEGMADIRRVAPTITGWQ